MIRQIVYKTRKSFSFFFLNLALKINSHKLTAIIFWLNIRKFKQIFHKKNNFKKVLVFSKSGGNEDLIYSFQKDYKNNIAFYWIPRTFLKKIYIFFLGTSAKEDYFTKLDKPKELKKKNRYVSFLILMFGYLNNLINFNVFVSFNIFYYAEKNLDFVFKKIKKKFFILHKESTFTPIEEIAAPKIYEKYNQKTITDKISVYSKKQRKILVSSKIANIKQIIVNGCPRSDYAFKLRKKKPKDNVIVYYLIEDKRSSNLLLTDKKLNWKKLSDKTLSYLLDYAKINPDVNIVLKGKTGVHQKKDYSSKILPKNCIFVEGGTGEKYLKDAKIVIAFNTTIMFEAIAGNRNLIIPNFNKENSIYKKYTYRIDNVNFFVNSKKEFFKKINYFLAKSYRNENFKNYEKKILDYYLGNTDGKSGLRLKNFIKSNI